MGWGFEWVNEMDIWIYIYSGYQLPSFAWFPQLCVIQTIQPIFNLILFRPSAVVSAADNWWDAMALFTSLSASRFLRPSGLHDPGDDDHRVDLWNFRWIEMTFDRDTEWTLSPLSPKVDGSIRMCSMLFQQLFSDFCRIFQFTHFKPHNLP